jgi:hypothetical protein
MGVLRTPGGGDESVVGGRVDLLAMARRFTTATVIAAVLAYVGPSVASGICAWIPWAIECW